MKHSKKTKPTDLKGKLRTAKVRFLFLPEVVRFDDKGNTDLSWEKLLQCLQQRLDQFPLRPTHVDDDSKTTFAYVLTDRRDRINSRDVVDERQKGKRITM